DLRQRRRSARARGASHRLLRRRAGHRLPLRRLEAVAHPRPAAGGRGAGRVPPGIDPPRRRVGQHGGVRRGAAPARLRGPRRGQAAAPPHVATGAARVTRIRSRLLVLGALALALVALFAAPASAHASLLSTDPSSGGVYDTPPKAITLRFDEGVEV